MRSTVSKKMGPRCAVRTRRKNRIRKKLSARRKNCPRLAVFRSNNFLYAQLVDDLKSTTLLQNNTREKDFSDLKSKKNIEAATLLGKLLGKRAVEKGVKEIVFDRGGYDYHGRVKALADGARESGLKF